MSENTIHRHVETRKKSKEKKSNVFISSKRSGRKPTSSSLHLDSASSVFCNWSQSTSSSSLSSPSAPLIVLVSSSTPSSSSCKFERKALLGVTGLKSSLGSNDELRGLWLIDPGLKVFVNKLLLLCIVPRVDTLVFRVNCLVGGSDRRTVTRESCSMIRFTAPLSGLELLRCRCSEEVGEGTAVEAERDETEEACLCPGPNSKAPTGLRVSRSASIGNGRVGSRPKPGGLLLERLCVGGPKGLVG